MPLSKTKTAIIEAKVSNPEHQIHGIIQCANVYENIMLSAPTALAGPAIPADQHTK